MATRRPKVPKASRHHEGAPEAAGKSESSDQQETRKAVPMQAGETSSSTSSRRPGAASAQAKSSARSGRTPGSSDRKGSTEPAAPVAARSFSGRLVALVVVLVAVTVMLAPSVNNFLQQKAEIAAVKADIANKQQQQKDLQNNISQWSDPAYIKQQARDRVSMMMPGETGYWVYGAADAPATPEKAGTSANPNSLPWVDGLWQSIIRSANE